MGVSMNADDSSIRERDAMTLRVLGGFFSLMGVLLLISSYGALGNLPALIVTIASGFVLLSVGTGMMMISRRLRKVSDDD